MEHKIPLKLYKERKEPDQAPTDLVQGQSPRDLAEFPGGNGRISGGAFLTDIIINEKPEIVLLQETFLLEEENLYIKDYKTCKTRNYYKRKGSCILLNKNIIASIITLKNGVPDQTPPTPVQANLPPHSHIYFFHFSDCFYIYFKLHIIVYNYIHLFSYLSNKNYLF